MLLRSLVLATAVATSAATAAGSAAALPLPPLPLLAAPQPDSLTVVVAKSGHPDADGTWTLTCDGARAGGNHPAAARACERLGGFAREGKDPFAPVPAGGLCAQVYGGPVTARVTGTWQGRRIDARFSRSDGCEIARWENAEPLLPGVRG